MGKLFRTLHNVFAWVWNHVWGTLFIAFGVYGLFNMDEFEWYIPLASIACGIYFYWSPKWSKAAEKVAAKVVDEIIPASTTTEEPPLAQSAPVVAAESVAPAAPVEPAAAEDPLDSAPLTLANLKKMRPLQLLELAIYATAVVWLAVGIRIRMLPVFFALLAAGGAVSYVRKRQRANRVSGSTAPSGQQLSAILEKLRPITSGALEKWKSLKPEVRKGVLVGAVAVVAIVLASSAWRTNSERTFANDTPEPGEVAYQAEPEVVYEEPADDMQGFVEFVRDQGGSIVINAQDNLESDPSRPALLLMTASEPFFEWVLPLAEEYPCAIGDRKVDVWELWAYVVQQEMVTLEVECANGSITSIICRPEFDDDGEQVLRENRPMYVSDLIYGAKSGTEAEVTFRGEYSSLDDGWVWFALRYDDYVQPVDADISELGSCYIDGVKVTPEEFLEAICSSDVSRGGILYGPDGIVGSWLGDR